jgi:hypothetical protein
VYHSGADPGLPVRVGAELEKIAPSGGRREQFWGISCEKSSGARTANPSGVPEFTPGL